jgi:Fuc2NAc and GlcNAc transferase
VSDRLVQYLPLLMVFGATWALTGALRRYAIRQSVMDVPNERSSHDVPTPRGGGLSVAVVVTLVLVLMFLSGSIQREVLIALGGGGGLVAAIGFWDDHTDLSKALRLTAQFGAGIWAVMWLGGAPEIPLGSHAVQLGLFGHVLGVVSIVWMINLFNFMDGIDAIASVEAITVSIGAGVILLAAGNIPLTYALLALAAATTGFLIWNWPPARIFMGDGGSSYIGFALAAAAVATSHAGGINLWSWLILFGVFVVDATVTLVVRMKRREPWYEAHRTHAYQHAARTLGSHLPVSLSTGAINLLWLFPLAWLASKHPHLAWAIAIVALVPLVFTAMRLRAGYPEQASERAAEASTPDPLDKST